MTLQSDGLRGPLDLTDKIIAFEQDDLEEEEIIELFQGLVDTGLAWQLQGFYGRTAVNLIEAGLVTLPAAFANRTTSRDGLNLGRNGQPGRS